MIKIFSCLRREAPSLVVLPVTVALWELIIWAFNISGLIMPSALDIIISFVLNFRYLMFHASITAVEAAIGFVMGSVFAVIAAIIFDMYPITRKAVLPYVVAMKATPLIALAPIVVLWLGSGLVSKIVMAAIMSFFPTLVSTLQGLAAVDREALELMNTLSATKWQVLRKLKIQAAASSIFSGLRISSTLAVVGAIVAEFTGSSQGIGYVIKTSSYYLDSALTFASVLMSSMMGVAMFLLVEFLHHRIVFWVNSGGADS